MDDLEEFEKWKDSRSKLHHLRVKGSHLMPEQMPDNMVDRNNEINDVAEELEFYREKLRFRGFDELPDEGSEIQVLHKDGFPSSFDWMFENGKFQREEFEGCYFEYSREEIINNDKSPFISWRYKVWDLIGEWNAIKAAKNVK